MPALRQFLYCRARQLISNHENNSATDCTDRREERELLSIRVIRATNDSILCALRKFLEPEMMPSWLERFTFGLHTSEGEPGGCAFCVCTKGAQY